MRYFHVDVFADRPFSGNGLTVFMNLGGFEKSHLQLITQEMRQFESIFLTQLNSDSFTASIFTMEEELNFAGHPVLGAAAILHELFSAEKKKNWTICLNTGPVAVSSIRNDGFYSVEMNQGVAQYGTVLTKDEEIEFLQYLNLTVTDKVDGMCCQVISTGLPYLIVPVKAYALSKVKVQTAHLEKQLKRIGAKFFYVLDVTNLEGRTWDNFGLVEDVATGSAAGPVGAFLVKNSLATIDVPIVLNQGAFLKRPSKLIVTCSKQGIFVKGDVYKIALGDLIAK